MTYRRVFRICLGLAILSSMVLASTSLRAQTTIENALKQLTGVNGQGYLQPAMDIFSANMNSGYYHSAAIQKTGFHLEFDIVMMTGMVGDDQKTFTAKAADGFAPAMFKTATIFGGKGSTIHHAAPLDSLVYRGPDGVFNTSMFPLAAPQLTIGSLYGTELTVRFVPLPELGNAAFPKSTLWAVGVRHNINQWFPKVPLDISASFFYSGYDVESLIDFKAYSLGAQCSKDFGVLTVYGGLAWENGTMDVNYVSTVPPSPGSVSIELEASNKFRFTAGAGLHLGFFRVFADANFGSVTHFSGGIGFGG